APVKLLQKIRVVTEKHNIVLILDEVQAGVARSEKMFACEHGGIEPDVIVMPKAVGGGFPLEVLGSKRKFGGWQPAGRSS
ncbi:aminotransferase class III-fold pyridoxal phosphate-dependent enzyme, partial [Acinetobacter baumannii]|uniref:aminotransferase class III-fold pyridoxal phosphate-dependent enzyme n=1 Tax=Acinetobacter baumannii TaxID=470 RepID=UPI00105AA917